MAKVSFGHGMPTKVTLFGTHVSPLWIFSSNGKSSAVNGESNSDHGMRFETRTKSKVKEKETNVILSRWLWKSMSFVS
jgi:hypothetical protein